MKFLSGLPVKVEIYAHNAPGRRYWHVYAHQAVSAGRVFRAPGATFCNPAWQSQVRAHQGSHVFMYPDHGQVCPRCEALLRRFFPGAEEGDASLGDIIDRVRAERTERADG